MRRVLNIRCSHETKSLKLYSGNVEKLEGEIRRMGMEAFGSSCQKSHMEKDGLGMKSGV